MMALIFGGTTEGRQLAEYCAANGISAVLSVVSEYGAKLLPVGVRVLVGRLDKSAMVKLLRENDPGIVIDATHPYAVEAGKNIKAACDEAGAKLYRLRRDCGEAYGEEVQSLEEMVSLLNECEGAVLSTLGSKAAGALAKVKGFRERIWLRVLDDPNIKAELLALGFDWGRIIMQRPPFSRDENIRHLRLSGAKIMLTKQSGRTGGYEEKIQAARQLGVRVINLKAPDEEGISLEEAMRLLKKVGYSK